MKILFDTNVLIAAFIAHGICSSLFEHCVLRHELVTSEFILSELREKLTNKFRFSTSRAAEVEQLLRSVMQVVGPSKLATRICRDEDDDNILAAALAGKCACLVTGDDDLIVIKEFQGIRILSPNDFIIYESSDY